MSDDDFAPHSASRPGGKVGAPPAGLPATPQCPFCDRTKTWLVSPFGSQLSVATYWCDRCRTAFEHIKWAGARPRPAL